MPLQSKIDLRILQKFSKLQSCRNLCPDTMKNIAIMNGTLISEGGAFMGNLYVRNGKIDYVGPDAPEGLSDADVVIDATGKYVSPGFIDMHTHGGGGKDFMDGDIDSYRIPLELHGSHGTTLMFPTTMSSTKESLFEAVKAYQKVKKAGLKGAAMGGLHLEGPYFAYSKKGAQDPRHLRTPDPQEYMKLVEDAGGDIARWSLAPELPGALEMARNLRGKGVVMAIGHTDATFEECDEAYEAGFTLLTHFFSCMSSVIKNGIDRHAGVVEYGYYNDDVVAEVIGDGVHVPAALLKLVFKVKGSDGVALITDSVSPAGLGEGRYILGSQEEGVDVIVEDGVAKLADRSALAGSVATMDMVVRTVRRLTGLPLETVVRSATETPAKVMGLADRKGILKVGYDADVIVFDEDVNVSDVIVGGKLQQF